LDEQVADLFDDDIVFGVARFFRFVA